MPKTRTRFDNLFTPKPIIGMIHLQALPGSPEYGGSLRAVLDAALQDVSTLIEGGVDALMIENFFDTPFFKDQVGPETIAAMTRIITEIRRSTSMPLGVNVLRNDGLSAVAIAVACECQFIRINQLSWATLADQGLIEGKAAQVLRFRRQLLSDVLIFADCLTKHAVSIAPQAMDIVAMDTWERGGADALVISGIATGKATDQRDVITARQGAPEAPLLLGSGVTAESLSTFLPIADGFIVGTYFKVDGQVDNPVDLARVREMVAVKKAFNPA